VEDYGKEEPQQPSTKKVEQFLKIANDYMDSAL
jgi:hypothetical protein